MANVQGDEKLALLKYAIENKYEIKFWYTGVKVKDPTNKKYTRQNWRFVQPVALGKSAGTGKLMLRAWQKGGITNTVKPAWKTFLLDELKTITVFDGTDGIYYRPFEKPAGPDYNDLGDEKMLRGKPIIKIDLTTPPGPNKGEIVPEPIKQPVTTPKVPANPAAKPKKMPPKQPVVKMKAKKMPPKNKKGKSEKKRPPDQDAVIKGPKEPIREPEEDNKIDAQIIQTKSGNPNNPKKMPPKKNKKEPEIPINLDEPINESRSWIKWLQKILNNG